MQLIHIGLPWIILDNLIFKSSLMTWLGRRVIFIKKRSMVFGIQYLEACVNYELFYNAQSYPPL